MVTIGKQNDKRESKHMTNREIYVPPTGPPRENPFYPGFFSEFGEEKVRMLFESFYDEIAISSIRDMFPEDLSESKVRTADFLIQVMGGFPCYSQKYGPPKMRARHIPFEIDENARMVWLDCFAKAMEKNGVEDKHKEILWKFVVEFSKWMVNKKD